MSAVTALQNDSNRKSLVKSYPVQSLFHIWQAAYRRAVFLKESPPNPLHFSFKPLPGIAQQCHVGLHSWTYVLKQVLPEIREHVPVTIIDQRQDGLADVSVLSLRNIQIGDKTVERRAYKAVVGIQLRILDRFLRRPQPLIDVAKHAQSILRFEEF